MRVEKQHLIESCLMGLSDSNETKQRRKELEKQIIVVSSYAEAAGYLLAHKNGIQFESITPTVNPIPITYLGQQ
jgi:hypothetical protein